VTTLEIVLTKADGAARDRALVVDGEGARAVAVHVVHDLPHLVVESLFGITDGLWGEIAGGEHAESSRAAPPRDATRQKQGRIVSGAASGAPTGAWLSQGHRFAKAVTNAVANQWADGPDTPEGVRDRIARQLPAAMARLEGVDDETIALAVGGVQVLRRRWAETPPGEVLRLRWPLPRSFLEDPGPGGPS
jgi:hypothetical protein